MTLLSLLKQKRLRYSNMKLLEPSLLSIDKNKALEQLKQIKDLSCYDCVILPGGGTGTKNLLGCEFLKAYLDDFVLHNKVVAAICAAPSVLGKLGYLENKKFTCFAGFNHGFGGKFTGAEVEIDGNIITGRSMQYIAT